MASGVMTRAAWVALLCLVVGRPVHAAAPDGAIDSCGSGADAVRIDVEITGIRLPKGNVTVLLYPDKPDDFLAKGKRLSKIRIPVHSNVVTACMTAPAPGRYAIAFYHDQNGDRKLDRTLMGRPAEGFGFSNDPHVSAFGLPRFTDVLFAAGPGDNRLKMTMRY